jgi:predicted metal-dependent hydrolase
MAEPALILTLVSDLFFAVQIENAIRGLGYRLKRIESGEQIEPEPPGPATTEHGWAYLGEPLTGRGAGFVARLVEWQPALVIVELMSTLIPWADWVAAMKSSPATRRIPVLAYGPHTNLELRAKAVAAGCDEILAQGRLVSALPELITKHARVVDENALADDCQGQVSALALKGIELFNQQQYFKAHEELELAWGQETGPVRELYRGILQVAVAYLQIERRNYKGAYKMFLRLRQWLDPLPDECRGVNVARLRAQALAARAELEALGPDGLERFDLSLLKPVELRRPGDRAPSNGH